MGDSTELPDAEHPLYGLIGICDEEEVETLRARSAAFRENIDDRMGRRS
jgi:hypothetical protein